MVVAALEIIWHKTPVVIRAVLTGLLVVAAGTAPWAFLAWLNLEYLPSIPWSVPVTALYLWFYWRFISGQSRPGSTATMRKNHCRANSLTGEVWGAAILAGIAGLVFIVVFQSFLARLVAWPRQSFSEYSQVPLLSLFLFALMSAIVAGVSEEAGFRGYMQKPIEQRYGPFTAIVLVGIVFGFAHFTHPELTIAMIPHYMVVAAVYGSLAWLTNSIYPGMVLRVGGNLFSALGLLASGGLNSGMTTPRKPLVWETGVDAAFLLSIGAVILVGLFTILAYRAMAGVVRRENHKGPGDSPAT